MKCFAHYIVAAEILFAAALNLSAQNLAVLHTFGASPTITNADGELSPADLVLCGDTLYGTARAGGTNGYGTVFSPETVLVRRGKAH